MPGFGQNPFPLTPRFHMVIGEALLRVAIKISNEDPIPRGLALDLRLPSRSPHEFESDMARLHREIDVIARLIDRDREVVELHVETGGLQRPFPMEAVRNLSEALRCQFHFSPAVTSEFSIAVDPEALAPDQIASLSADGFNRISFAGSRLDPGLLRAARDNGFRSVAVATSSMKAALKCADEFRPDRLFVVGQFAGPLERAQEPSTLHERLDHAGYLYIGLGQFALPEDDLAVALQGGQLQCGPSGFTAHADCDWLGFGPGAISHVGGCYSRNDEILVSWRSALDAGRLPARRGLCLAEDDELRGELIQQLLCRRQIDISELERRYGIKFRSYFADDLLRLTPCLRLGLVRDLGDRIAVSSRGWPWLRNIALCFDAHAGDGTGRPEALRRN